MQVSGPGPGSMEIWGSCVCTREVGLRPEEGSTVAAGDQGPEGSVIGQEGRQGGRSGAGGPAGRWAHAPELVQTPMARGALEEASG